MGAIQHRSGGGRRRALAEINVVPYIDVMLVLLIIFMVTAPLITPSAVKLPTVGAASRAPDTLIEVDIKADKTLSLRLRDPKAKTQQPPQNVSPADLLTTVGGLATQAGSTLGNMPVLIAADKDVRYADVIKVLDQLKQGGVLRVGLAVQATGSR